MRTLRGFITGWCVADGIRLICGQTLKMYPPWVPLMILAVLCVYYEVSKVLKEND
jgi:hypothetical protein